MRAVGAARWFLSFTSIATLAAIFAPERAYAACDIYAHQGVIATGGSACAAPADVYSGLVVPPLGVGLYANGATINSASGVDVETTGSSAYDLYATDGGSITFTDGKVRSDGAFALYVTGVNSTITVNPTLTLFIESFGAGTAFNDGAGASDAPGLNLTGSTLVASGTAAFGVYTTNGGITALSGGSVSTAGDSAPGLWASGVGGKQHAFNDHGDGSRCNHRRRPWSGNGRRRCPGFGRRNRVADRRVGPDVRRERAGYPGHR